MRLGFAIAAFLQADVLLLDEVFAVGDENFQRKCFGVIAAFKNRGGTILFVSHDAQSVERLCERSILLSAGEKAYRRPHARGGRTLPAAAGRRCRPLRALRRPTRMGHGRGRDHGSACARRGRRGAGAVPRGRAVPARGRSARQRAAAAAAAPPRGARHDRSPRGRGGGRNGDARLARRRRQRHRVARCRAPGVRVRPLPRTTRPRRRPTGERCISTTTQSPSSSTRTATSGASCGSEEHGETGRIRRPDELQDLPRLARADGARTGPPVQAHHRGGRAVAVRRALEDLASSRSGRSRSAATSSTTSSTQRTPTPRS